MFQYVKESKAIEDVIPLYNVKFSINAPKIEAVKCQPEKELLKCEHLFSHLRVFI